MAKKLVLFTVTATIALVSWNAHAATVIETWGGTLGDNAFNFSFDPTGHFEFSSFNLFHDTTNQVVPLLIQASEVGFPGGPAAPNLNPALPPSRTYVWTLTFPSVPTSATATPWQMFWEEFYFRSGGKLQQAGGDDTFPQGTAAGPFPLQIGGNSISYRFTNEILFNGDVEDGDGLVGLVQYRWPSVIVFDAQLSAQDVGLPWSAVLTAVPEPNTWVLMMLGMGAVGCSLRVSRRKRSVLMNLQRSHQI